MFSPNISKVGCYKILIYNICTYFLNSNIKNIQLSEVDNKDCSPKTYRY